MFSFLLVIIMLYCNHWQSVAMFATKMCFLVPMQYLIKQVYCLQALNNTVCYWKTLYMWLSHACSYVNFIWGGGREGKFGKTQTEVAFRATL